MRVFITFLQLFLLVEGSVHLHQKLHYFETLHSRELNVATRKKRSVDGRFSFRKEIGFKAFGRDFRLILYPGSPVLDDNFEAKVIDKDGRVKSFVVNPNDFYTGHLAGAESISVDAHFDDGILSSNIHFPHELYTVEPAWRHLPPSDNYSMIVYRRSDINWENIFPIDPVTGKRTRLKDGIKASGKKRNGSIETHHPNNPTANETRRHKRAVKNNACSLLVVADYLFFLDIGGRSLTITAAFLISTLQRINRLFERTVWDPDYEYVNMGFIIAKMEIHTHFTNEPGHYNSEKSWHYCERLNAFKDKPFTKLFCLCHLYTSSAFPDNVLGLAYLATPFHCGGICSEECDNGFLNKGMTSAKNSKHQLLLTQELELISTHGHNWGAQHDPHTNECGPSSQNHGKYIMWPSLTTGYEDNNKHVLVTFRRYSWGTQTTTTTEKKSLTGLCGNGIIEMHEECDVGFTMEGVEDPCCDKFCQLKQGAQCSDLNYPCCKNCQPASPDVLCEAYNELSCKDQSFCDGKRIACPAAGDFPDGTGCIDLGKCYNGKCLDFCALRGRNLSKTLTPCLCAQNATAMCRRCCVEVNGTSRGECLPTEVVVEAGRTCHMGTCNDFGECIKSELRLTHRIFNFIRSLTVDKLVEFMRTNIVGTTIVLSLMVWVPVSWVFSFADIRNKRKEELKLAQRVRRHGDLMISQPEPPIALTAPHSPVLLHQRDVPDTTDNDDNLDTTTNVSCTRKASVDTNPDTVTKKDRSSSSNGECDNNATKQQDTKSDSSDESRNSDEDDGIEDRSKEL